MKANATGFYMGSYSMSGSKNWLGRSSIVKLEKRTDGAMTKREKDLRNQEKIILLIHIPDARTLLHLLHPLDY